MSETPSIDDPNNKPSEKSERQGSRWDIEKGVGNYSSLVISQGISALLSFASVWLVVKFMGTEGYGGVVAVVTASGVAQIFVNWTAIGLARLGVEEFVEKGEISTAFWGRTTILVANLIVVIALSPFWLPTTLSWLKIPSSLNIWLVVAHLFVIALWINIQHGFQAAKLPRVQGLLLSIERFFILAGILIVILIGELSVFSTLLIYIIASGIVTIAGLWKLKPYISRPALFSKDFISRLLGFTLPMFPYSIIGYLSTNQLDTFFIANYLTQSDIGIYQAIFQVSGLLGQAIVLANSLIMNWFITLKADGQEEKIQRYFTDFLPVITLLWGGVCLLMAGIFYWLLPVLYGNEFQHSGPVVWVLLISTSLSCPILAGYIPLFGANLTSKPASLIAITTAVTNVVFNFLLIPRFGLVGCAAATVISSLFGFCALSTLSKRLFGIHSFKAVLGCLPIMVGSILLVLTQWVWLSLLIASILFLTILFFWKTDLKDTITFGQRRISRV